MFPVFCLVFISVVYALITFDTLTCTFYYRQTSELLVHLVTCRLINLAEVDPGFTLTVYPHKCR